VEASRSFEVDAHDAGQRLDVMLARALGVSRGHVRRLLERERVRLSGRPAAKGTLLRAGDVVEVVPFRPPEAGPPPQQELALSILRDEAGLVAVDKPAGLPTHPLDCDETGTVLNAFLARFPEALGVGEGGARSGVVHRLDTGTSGVLVFAREQGAWERARRAFTTRGVEKVYLARVHGRFERAQRCEIRLEHRGDHMRVVTRGGRLAVTDLRALRHDDGETLVEARPVTGLTHQIRATLAALGHPIVGDERYGSAVRLGRHLLHATGIRIESFAADSPAPPEIVGRVGQFPLVETRQKLPTYWE
jgi:23S rRNA pseudouridine1911/1915/1917 synthase